MTLEEALYWAFKELNIKCPRNQKSITIDDIVLALVLDETKLPELLGYSASGDGGFKNFRKHLLPNKPSTGISYIKYILWEVGLSQCCRCKEIKNTDSFSIDNSSLYNITSLCKACDNIRDKNKEKQNISSKLHYKTFKSIYLAKNALRRTTKIRATPNWADLDLILEIYNKCPIGYHVDHIIPLQGKLVCGLHIENNLQYLTVEDNLKKSNKFEIT